MVKENTTTETHKEEAPKKKTVRKTVAKKTITKRVVKKKTEPKTEQKEVKAQEVNTQEVKAQEANVLEVNVKESVAENSQEKVKVVAKENVQEASEVNTTEVNSTEVKVQEKKVAEVKVPKKVEIPQLPAITIHDIVELSQAPQRAIVLTDQQIQQLSIEDIHNRHVFLQQTLANVLDYDIVISDTNVWLELLVGHVSSHSDPRYNARLQFERQLEFISKLMKYRGGRFVMMAETYEEIDRFACMQDPANHRDADFTDNIVCLNTAARLAKRLILSQQRENRLRIDGIGAESHHASFADPAIIRRVADLFAAGKKVLLLTNDASVAIRSMGVCDDLQRHNNISDEEWDEKYAPLRPMVFTFDDLKMLDFYTRQYHYIQMASGEPWMEKISRSTERESVEPLTLSLEAFRPGDKHRGDNLFTEQEQKQLQQKQQLQQKTQQQQLQQQQKQQQKQNNNTQKQQAQQQPKQQESKEQPKPKEQKSQEQQPTEQSAQEQPVAQKPKTRRAPRKPKNNQ